LFLAGLLLLAGVSGGVYVLAGIELPTARLQAQTSFVCGVDIASGCSGENAIARLAGEQDRVDVDLAQVPAVVVDAVLATEDRDFYRHSGIDPVGIFRAALADVRGGGISQGGSTITQQLVKNVYLSNERTLVRKIKEAVLAIKVERELSKDEILERYLNTVYFGRGAYGIVAASRAYFGVPVAELDLAQAAYLAGLIRAPEAADATRDPDAATGRRRGVLDAMLEEKYIDAAQRQAADARPWVVAPLAEGGTVLPRSERQGYGTVVGRQWGADYFVDYVVRQLTGKLGFPASQVYGGGLRIYTSLDLQLQQAGFESIAETLDEPDDPLAALVAVDEQGLVRAMVGGRDFATNKVNLAVGREGGGSGRQAGSAMKPFTLAAAVHQGISLRSRFEAPGEITLPRANGGRDWEVRNYGGTEQGVLDLIEATRVSSNTAYAQLMLEVGPQNVVPLAEQMGITSPLDEVNALVLGTEEVSPLEMASAFSTLGRGGVYAEPTAILRVEDAGGKVLWSAPQTRSQVLSEAEANQVIYALRQVVSGGTGTGASIGKPAAGKTGTTQDNLDAWFVGFTPNGWTAAVWMGYDAVHNEDGSVEPRYMDDVHGRAVTGGSFPATIWRRFMARWTEGVDVGSFTTPNRFPGKVLNPSLEEERDCPEGEEAADGDECAPTTTSASSSTTSSSTTTTAVASTTSTSSTTSTTEATTTTTAPTTSSTTDDPFP
jgi:penicillin-binding protein 1A